MKAMKIGLVTFCGNNFGSVLQCYATQAEFQKRGMDCVLVVRKEKSLWGRMRQVLEFRLDRYWKVLRYPHHRQEFRECLVMMRSGSNSNGLRQEAEQAIHTFIAEHIRREALSWRQMKQLARSQECGFFLSGSDQIWSARWFVTNRVWFLRFCPPEKRVAWMPSFGADQLAEYNRPTYTRYIAQYAALSVREEAGRRIIEDLLHISVPALADPVFLLDADGWRKIAAGPQQDRPYILMFFLEKPSAVAMRQMQLLRDATGYEVVCFSYDYQDPSASVVSGGPEAFLYIMDHAEVVLTDSFHACAFASIFGRPFYAFARSDVSGSKQMVRVQNLLKSFGIEQRYIETQDACVASLSPLPEQTIQHELEKKRQSICGYLEEILDRYRGEEA